MKSSRSRQHFNSFFVVEKSQRAVNFINKFLVNCLLAPYFIMNFWIMKVWSEIFWLKNPKNKFETQKILKNSKPFFLFLLAHQTNINNSLSFLPFFDYDFSFPLIFNIHEKNRSLRVRQHISKQLLLRGCQNAREFDVKCHQEIAFSCWVAGQWKAISLYSLDGIWFNYFVFCTYSQLFAGHRRHFKYHATESLQQKEKIEFSSQWIF